MVAMLESASMDCARVMRGISSMERNVTPASARPRAASPAVRGSPKPMTVCPRRMSARSRPPVSGLAPGERTWRSTSAAAKTSSREASRTPFSVYSASGNPASAPAPDSIRNSLPVLLRTESAPGTMATRRSPGADSDTIPIVRGTPKTNIGPRMNASSAAGSNQLARAEEESQFCFSRFRSIGAVDAIALDIRGEALADGSLGGLLRIGRAHYFAQAQDGVLAFQRHHDDRTFGHELHQAAEERAVLVHRVKALRLLFGEARHAQRQDLEAGLLNHGENLAGLPGGYGIGLDDGKCAFDRHSYRQLFTFSPISAGVEQTTIPASCMALILSPALPLPPAMMAPACPMRRPGGAVCPATKPTTGFFTCAFT